MAAGRRRPGTHNARRRHVEALLARHFHDQYRRAAEHRARRSSGDDAEPGFVARDDLLDEAELWRAVRRLPEVVEALDRIWPLLSPQELLHDMYGAPPLLRLAARGVLSAEEQGALHRQRSSTLESIPWTASDVPLLDEARVLLGSRHPSTEADELRTYGHIVVDEAQDLTPMQLRMLARRSLSGSMTVVGDIAQATGPRAPLGWEEVIAHLPGRRPARMVELSVNYRMPAEIMALAAQVLAAAAPGLLPPDSVRSTDVPPAFVAAEAGELGRAVSGTADEEVRAVADGTVALITAPSLVEPVSQGLEAAGVSFGRGDRQGLDGQVTLLPVGVAKGLEFDSVVVVEPARIVAESAQGLRALYVALTRTTRRLTIVHAEPLPEALMAPVPG